MITQIDRNVARLLRDELDKALIDTGKRLGVSIKMGSCTYTPNNARFKVEIAVINASGEVISKEVTNFKNYAPSYGIPADSLGKPFTSFDGKTYTIKGFRPKSWKNPILADNINGRTFKFPVEYVKSRLGIKSPAAVFPISTERNI